MKGRCQLYKGFQQEEVSWSKSGAYKNTAQETGTRKGVELPAKCFSASEYKLITDQLLYFVHTFRINNERAIEN